jgi:Na+/H+-dicarboxylate symporter
MKNTTSSSFLKITTVLFCCSVDFCGSILGLVLEGVEVIGLKDIFFKFIVHRNNSFGVFTIASSIASLEKTEKLGKIVSNCNGVFYLRWFRPS